MEDNAEKNAELVELRQRMIIDLQMQLGLQKEIGELKSRLAAIVESSDDAIIGKYLRGIITSWNKGAERMFSYTAEETVGRHISFIYPEDQRHFLEHEIIAPLKEKVEHESEVRMRRKSGEEFYAILLLSLLRDGSGAPTGMAGSSIDISARKKAEELIRFGKEEWEQTFDAIPDMVAVIDNQHVIRRANKAFAAKLGTDWNELIGKYCYRAICGSEKQLSNCSGSMAALTGRERIEERYIEKLKGHYLISCTPIFAFDGSTYGFVEVWRDISQQKETENKLYEAANTDILTGLYNRRGFFALAEHQLRVADRENKSLILIYLDLNDMKRINDQFGHKEGDRALADMANILRKSFRESDVLGRLGGDEFAILLKEPSEEDIEQIICEHIQQNLNSHNEKSGRPYLLSVSIGIAHYHPAAPCTLDDILTTADKMMYREKGHLKPERYN